MTEQDLKQEALNKAYETGWYGQKPVRDIEEHLLNDNSKMPYIKKVFDDIAKAEDLGIDCTALKRNFINLEAAGFDPDKHTLELSEDVYLEFNPELLAEVPEVIVFEN